MKTLRITFCILACISVAAVVPLGIFFGWWCLTAVCAALLFGFLMLAAKNGFRRPVLPPKPDFMNSDEENARLTHHDDER